MKRGGWLVALCLLGCSKGRELQGTWELAGRPFAVFSADGTGSLDGRAVNWKVEGDAVVYNDGAVRKLPFALSGDQLTLKFADRAVVLQRAGSQVPMAPKSAAAPATAPPAAAPDVSEEEAPAPARRRPARAAGGDRLSQLLLSSAWCTFRYNATTGYSSSSRVQFFANGSWSSGARGEGYSSGTGGTFASQHDSGASGRWKVQGGQLFLSEGDEALEAIDLQVTANSNGAPILRALGNEYSSCD